MSSQCRSRGVPRDLARDFAQQTVLKALAHVRTYQQDGVWPLPKLSSSWLFQIGYNLIADWIRHNRRASKAQMRALENQKLELSSEGQERREEVLKYFRWLTPSEKDIIELVLIEGLHPLEAGERLNLSDAAAYKAYERAITHLRDLIQKHSELVKRTVS